MKSLANRLNESHEPEFKLGDKFEIDGDIYTISKSGMRRPEDRLGKDEYYLTCPGRICLDLSAEFLRKQKRVK